MGSTASDDVEEFAAGVSALLGLGSLDEFRGFSTAGTLGGAAGLAKGICFSLLRSALALEPPSCALVAGATLAFEFGSGICPSGTVMGSEGAFVIFQFSSIEAELPVPKLSIWQFVGTFLNLCLYPGGRLPTAARTVVPARRIAPSRSTLTILMDSQLKHLLIPES